jgi:hypothetical protein
LRVVEGIEEGSVVVLYEGFVFVSRLQEGVLAKSGLVYEEVCEPLGHSNSDLRVVDIIFDSEVVIELDLLQADG